MVEGYFCLHLLDYMNSFRLIVNVDGWILTRSIKQNYCWLEKGKSWRLYNSQYTGSMSLLSAISSDGSSFTAAYSSTIDSTTLLAFIESLMKYYSKWSIGDNSEVLLIMDNCPYQASNSTKDKLKRWKINTLYLPPYWPELAPVELLFRSLKSKLRCHREKEHVNFLSQNGIELASSTLKKIRPREVINYWNKFYSEVKHCLHFIRNNC